MKLETQNIECAHEFSWFAKMVVYVQHRTFLELALLYFKNDQNLHTTLLH